MSGYITGVGAIGAGAMGEIGGLARGVRTAGSADGASFGDTLKQALGQVSAVQDDAAAKVGAFIRGENVELHQVMAATEEAGIALEMLVEVRNKLIEGYQALANMQS